MGDWKECKLGDLIVHVVDNRGKNPPYSDSGHEVIETACISGKQKFPNYSLVKKHVDEETYNDWFRSGHPQKNDLLIITVGNGIGSVAIMPDERGVLTQNLIGLRFDDYCDSNYYYYYLNQNAFQDFLKSMDIGSAQPSLKVPHLRSVDVPIPPLPEQKAIASVLSSLDDKIDLLHRQNKTLEAMAETLFRQWFDGYEKKKHVLFQLKALVKHVKPGTNYQPKRIENGIPFLNVRNLSNGFIDETNFKFISNEEYKKVHKVWKPEENDILISRIGTLGVVAIIRMQDLPIAVHYNMLNLKAKKTSYQFLYYLLKSKYFQVEYDTVKRVSVQEYVAVEDAESIEIPLPSSQDQMQYLEEQLTCFFAKTLNNYNQICTLEKLRDTLLPKLMSGEVRVAI